MPILEAGDRVTASGFGAVDKLSLAGGTMTGDITLAAVPASPFGAIPREYADQNFTGVVVYSGGVWPARPSTIGTVLWIGPSPPPGATGSDPWINSAGTGGGGGTTSVPALTDANGGVWLLTITATYPVNGSSTITALPVLQDQSGAEITDQASNWME